MGARAMFIRKTLARDQAVLTTAAVLIPCLGQAQEKWVLEEIVITAHKRAQRIYK